MAAPRARRPPGGRQALDVAVTHMGGEVFSMVPAHSDQSVMLAELFGENERKFLREMQTNDEITLILADTFRIHVRTVWNSEAALRSDQVGAVRRKGKFVTFLHAHSMGLTTSWTWAKFIRPMYRQGFSVILVDLPGFGRSTASQIANCPPSRWKADESQILVTVLQELGVPETHFVACYEGCGHVIRMLQRIPHRVMREHIFYNPILEQDELFTSGGIDPPPGAGVGWRDDIKKRQRTEFEDLLRMRGTRLWWVFDSERDWCRNADTFELIVAVARNPLLSANMFVQEVTGDDLCDAQAGRDCPVRLIVPSRCFKACCAHFLKGRHPPAFVPRHQRQGSSPPGTPTSDRSRNSRPQTGSSRPQTGSLALAGSASAGQLRRTQTRRLALETGSPKSSMSAASLGNSTQMALGLLRSRGIGDGQVPMAFRNHEVVSKIDWSRSPFDRDLSYGVRKMVADTIDRSVLTFEVEEEARRLEGHFYRVHEHMSPSASRSLTLRDAQGSRC